MSEKTTKGKKRNSYSFSIRKTDNPVISEFLKKQTNYSESLRYLIVKFCRENGVEDISNKLNELIYATNFSNLEISDNSNRIQTVDNERNEVLKGSTSKELSQGTKFDDEIPECYDSF